jgi:hypothetical protein
MPHPSPPLPDQPFGDALSAAVANLIDRGGRVLWGWNAHWMLKKGDRLVYEALKDQRRELFSAPDQHAFAAWLAQQTPNTLLAFVRPSCADTVETISHTMLAEAVAANQGINDPTPYGLPFANAVADALERGVVVAYAHRDYGGMGLASRPNGYAYGPVFDGDLLDGTVYPTRAAFVTWLAQQSDASLAGRDEPSPFDQDNQRLTRARLIEATRTRSD